VRLNFVKRLVDFTPKDELLEIAKRVQMYGWHVVIYFEAVDLPELWDFFTALPTNIVVDHMGRPDVTKPVDGPEFELFVKFMREHTNVWTKVTCPERLSVAGPNALNGEQNAYQDVIPFAKRIVDDEIIPRFKEGRFADGLERGTDVLMGLAKGEYTMPSRDKVPVWPVLIVIAVFVFLVAMAWRQSVNRYAKTNSIDFWTALWLMSQAQRTHPGRWGGFTGGGGGGFGGGGGGGFGGFGGGSFGGGGAGGSW
jgi:hypothetical protein